MKGTSVRVHHVLFLFWLYSFFIAAQTPVSNFLATSGTIYSVVKSNDGSKIFVGGEFNYVGKPVAANVIADSATLTYQSTSPIVTGYITAVCEDGAGGFYVGGKFTEINGHQVYHLARIKSDNTLDVNFNAQMSAQYDEIYSLYYYNNIVYVGGNFSSILGSTRTYVAAINASNGTLNAWEPQNIAMYPYCFLASGSTIYIGGQGYVYRFSQPVLSNIGAFDISTGALQTTFDCRANNRVRTMLLDGGQLILGGDFTFINSVERWRLIMVSPTTGAIVQTPAGVQGSVYSLSVYNGVLYVGGTFNAVGTSGAIGGNARVNRSTGLYIGTNEWGNVLSSKVVNGMLFIASSTIGMAKFKTSTLTKPDDAKFYTGNTTAIAFSGSKIFAAGAMTTYDPYFSRNLAIMDTETGELSGTLSSYIFFPYRELWGYPQPDAKVSSMVIVGDTLMIAGAFGSVLVGPQISGGTISRLRLAGMVLSDYSVTDLSLDFTINNTYYSTVDRILYYGNQLYIFGNFNKVNNQTRGYAAKYDLATRTLSSWNPAFAYQPTFRSTLGVSGKLFLSGAYYIVDNYYTVIKVDTGTAAITHFGNGITGNNNYISANAAKLFISGDYFYNGQDYIGFLGSYNLSDETLAEKIDTGTAGKINFLYNNDLYFSYTKLVGSQYINYLAKLNPNSLSTAPATTWQIAGQNAALYDAFVTNQDVFLTGYMQGIGTFPSVGSVRLSMPEPLPVELANFNANYRDGAVLLSWQTENEVNAYSFTVERRKSEDAVWQTAGELRAYGNSNAVRHYQFNDSISINGTYIYRLKMTDNDGSFEYSNTLTVSVVPAENFAMMQNFPNPFNPETNITYTLPVSGIVSLTLYSVAGEKIKDLVNQQNAEPGAYTISLNGTNLASGTYIYSLKFSDAKGNLYYTNRKMILLK